MTQTRAQAFEERLSEFVANSGLSADETIAAVGIMMARILFGIEILYGKSTAEAACELLDKVMCDMWDFMNERPDKQIH